jgi:pyruvate/2-oxoglutarate/acetoin dehydrogenase E1 component
VTFTEGTTTYREAIRLALADAMRSDRRVILLGEDIGVAGGVFKVTEGLIDEFTSDRVIDTPISETGFVGAAIGMALAGFRPVVELMFADFAAVAWDQIVNQAAKYRYLSAGQMHIPLVIRCCGGAGGRFAAQHSQTTESWFACVPGLKVVAASNPQDAYSLTRAAIADDGPVVVIEHKALYTMEGPLSPTEKLLPLGTARSARSGRDATVVASLAMVPRAVTAGDALASEEISVEVIDLRSVRPLDIETIVGSVQRTGRLVTVEEQPVDGGWGSQVVASVVERCFDRLLSPPARLGTPDAPIGFSPVLEDAALPSVAAITATVRAAVRWS